MNNPAVLAHTDEFDQELSRMSKEELVLAIAFDIKPVFLTKMELSEGLGHISEQMSAFKDVLLPLINFRHRAFHHLAERMKKDGFDLEIVRKLERRLGTRVARYFCEEWLELPRTKTLIETAYNASNPALH